MRAAARRVQPRFVDERAPIQPVLTFRVPQALADELGRFVALWQAAFLEARAMRDADPDQSTDWWFMLCGSYKPSMGCQMPALSEGSVIVSGLLATLEEYRRLILRASEEPQSDDLRALARPLVLWAHTHPKEALWELHQRHAERTERFADVRRGRKRGQATLHGTRKSQRAKVRAIPTADGGAPPS